MPLARTLIRSLGPSCVISILGFCTYGCGGSTQPAERPEEPVLPLEDEGEEQEAPPSSPEVKAAIDKIKAQQFAEAETILEKATRDAPDDPQAVFFYGVALEGVGKEERAMDQYRRAIELTPKLIESFQNLSALLLAQEEYKQALDVADAGLAHAPEDAALLGNRALALDMLENPLAISAYEKLLRVAPDDHANRFNYAVVLFLNQRADDAKTQLAKIKTTEMSLLVDMEKLYLEMKDPGSCVELWDRAMAQNERALFLSHRGRCKLMAGDKLGGEADLRSALRKEEKSTIAHYYLAKFLQKEGKSAEAKKHFQVAAQGNDEFAQAAQGELSR